MSVCLWPEFRNGFGKGTASWDIFSLKDRVANLDSIDNGICRITLGGWFEFLRMYSISLFGFVYGQRYNYWDVSCIKNSTLESRIIGGVGIIGGLDIVIIINNRGVGIIGGGRGWKNSVGGFLVLIC